MNELMSWSIDRELGGEESGVAYDPFAKQTSNQI